MDSGGQTIMNPFAKVLLTILLILMGVLVAALIFGEPDTPFFPDKTTQDETTQDTIQYPIPDFGMTEADIRYFDIRAEVINIYRIYDGTQLSYGIDYIDEGMTLTLIAPSKYNRNSIDVYSSTDENPINESYLIFEEGWIIYEKGKVERYYGRYHYRLYISDDTPIKCTTAQFSEAIVVELRGSVATI